MGKKSFGVSALSEALENRENNASPDTQLTKPVHTKAMSSPMNSPGMSKTTPRIQRLYLEMPVTKTRAECELLELDPGHCIASPFNKRIQSLLSPDDPEIQQLKASIQTEGQRDPVLVRPRTDPVGDVRYEIVYGTRRRYCAALIAAERKGAFKLKAWVSDKITDPDAKRLAESENDDRQDISAWEIAKYYERLKAERSELTLEAMAGMEGVDASSVSRYLTLARLPEATVKLVASPAEITLRSGLDILKALKVLQPAKRDALMKALTADAPFATAATLVKAIKALTQSKPEAPTKNEKIEVLSESGQRRAVIGAHRSTERQYKVDLYDVSATELAAVQQALQKVFGK